MTRFRRWRAVAWSIALFAVMLADGANRAAVAGAPASKRVSVLVHLEPHADRGPVRRFAHEKGGRVAHEYTILPNVVNLREVPEEALDELGRKPGVFRVELDPVVELHLNQSTSIIGALQSQVDLAGFSADGTGVRVCVIDTGIRADHIMVVGRIDTAAGFDFADNDPDPDDVFGHGSHVMGIAIGGDDVVADFGCDPEPPPLQGVAPRAVGIAEKVIAENGTGTGSDIIAAIQRCASPTLPGGRAHVINMSLGGGNFTGTCDNDSIAKAANAAVDAGLTVVASAGNQGATGLPTPACASKVISVGATWDAEYPTCDYFEGVFEFCLDSFCFQTCTDDFPQPDQIACFSNRSTNLDVVAPGAVIWSAEPSETNTIAPNFGTSMSAPHVAGLAALLLSQSPGLTPAQVGQAIREGAVDLGAANFDTTYGHGRIDALGSLNLVATPTCSTAGDCDDGNGCTTDACNGGTCSHAPVVCGDGNSCTTDQCNPATGSCSHAPVDCNDQNACTVDGCNTSLGCTTTPVSCGDGNACTIDSCNPATGCGHQAVNCNDGNACTTDSCNSASGCVHQPISGCGTCLASGAVCSSNAQCCSRRCKGTKTNKTCR